jgi:hypothetical protein
MDFLHHQQHRLRSKQYYLICGCEWIVTVFSGFPWKTHPFCQSMENNITKLQRFRKSFLNDIIQSEYISFVVTQQLCVDWDLTIIYQVSDLP